MATSIFKHVGNNAIIASIYSTLGTYAEGSYCIYNNTLYRCTTTITTPESWTAEHWTETTLGADVSIIRSDINKLGLSVVDGKLCHTYVV